MEHLQSPYYILFLLALQLVLHYYFEVVGSWLEQWTGTGRSSSAPLLCVHCCSTGAYPGLVLAISALEVMAPPHPISSLNSHFHKCPPHHFLLTFNSLQECWLLWVEMRVTPFSVIPVQLALSVLLEQPTPSLLGHGVVLFIISYP